MKYWVRDLFTSATLRLLDTNDVLRGVGLAFAIAIHSGQKRSFRNFFADIKRYIDGVGRQVRICSRTYDNFINRHPIRSYPTSEGTLRSFKKALLLYLSDVKKAQGRFLDAEEILLKLSSNHDTAYEALCALGDLMLTQAYWAYEFRVFLSDGLIIDPRDLLERDTWTWHSRTYEEVINVLRSAISANPNDERAYWLLALSCIECGKVSAALRAVEQIEPYFPADSSEFGHLRMKVLFHREPDKAVANAIEQFRGWRDERGKYWTAYEATLCRARDLPEENGFKLQKIGEQCSTNISATVVFEGQITERTSSITFDPPHIGVYDNATILPVNGLVTVQSGAILEDSSHHPRIHLDVFAPNVRSVGAQSALVCMPEPDDYPYEDCVYIGNNANYYHWLIEDLPRLRILKEASLIEGRCVLVDQNIRSWQIELLEFFDIPASRLRRVDFSRPVRLPNVVIPSLLSRSSIAHPKAVQFIRETLLKDCPDACPKPGKRLYVSRSSVPGRQMLNASEINSIFRRAGFQAVDPSTLSIREQIELFHDAEVVAGPAGAGLTNMVFAPAEAHLIHFGPLDIAGHTFTSIANAIGQRSCLCVGRSHARTYPRWIWTNFDFRIDPNDVELCLSKMS